MLNGLLQIYKNGPRCDMVVFLYFFLYMRVTRYRTFLHVVMYLNADKYPILRRKSHRTHLEIVENILSRVPDFFRILFTCF